MSLLLLFIIRRAEHDSLKSEIERAITVAEDALTEQIQQGQQVCYRVFTTSLVI
jgi:hypothetical protein